MCSAYSCVGGTEVVEDERYGVMVVEEGAQPGEDEEEPHTQRQENECP